MLRGSLERNEWNVSKIFLKWNLILFMIYGSSLIYFIQHIKKITLIFKWRAKLLYYKRMWREGDQRLWLYPFIQYIERIKLIFKWRAKVLWRKGVAGGWSKALFVQWKDSLFYNFFLFIWERWMMHSCRFYKKWDPFY